MYSSSLSRNTLKVVQRINCINFRILPLGRRCFATRGEFDSPFDHLPKRAPKPWLNWKSTVFFFITGTVLAYNESLFEVYANVTDTSGDDNLTRLKLEYELKNLPIYEKLAHPKKVKIGFN